MTKKMHVARRINRSREKMQIYSVLSAFEIRPPNQLTPLLDQTINMFEKAKQLLSDVVHFCKYFHLQPYKRIRQLHHVINLSLSLVGLGILDRNWKFSVLTGMKTFSIITFSLVWLYSVWFYRNKKVFILQAFCAMGIYLPVSTISQVHWKNCQLSYLNFCQNMVKLFVMIKEHRSLLAFAEFGERLYYDNEPANISGTSERIFYERIKCTRDSIQKTYRTLMNIMIAIFLSGPMFVGYPVYSFFILKEHVYLIPLVIPFLDPESERIFYVNLSLQCFYASSGVLTAACMDLFYSICICNHRTASKLIIQSINELNDMWVSDTQTQLDRNAKLINIFKQFQDAER